MAYEKQTWANGDVITAEKLNHIEDGIENGDNGYECGDIEFLFNETITSEPNVIYDNYTGAIIDFNFGEKFGGDYSKYPKLLVTFDGVYYEARFYSGFYHGYPDSPNPFCIAVMNDKLGVVTATEGEHTIKVEAEDETVNTTVCFDKAVTKVVRTVERTIWHFEDFPFSSSGQRIYNIPKDFVINENTILLVIGKNNYGVFGGFLKFEWSYSMSGIDHLGSRTIQLDPESGHTQSTDYFAIGFYGDEYSYPFVPTNFRVSASGEVNGSVIEGTTGTLTIIKIN